MPVLHVNSKHYPGMFKQNRQRNAKMLRKKGFRNYLSKKNVPSLIGYIRGSKLGFPFPGMLATKLKCSVLNAVSLTLAGVAANAGDYF